MERLLKYVLRIPGFPEEGHSLLVNLTNGSVVRVSDRVLDSLQRGDGVGDEHRQEMRDMGFLVPTDFDDFAFFNGWINRGRYGGRLVTAMVMLTEACNLACKYCSQYGMGSNVRMQESTVDEILAWFGRLLREERTEALIITHYGGEPLLNVPAMVRLGQGLTKICGELGIKFEQVAITNGTLLTSSVIDAMLSVPIHAAQVTVDGPKEIHDARKPAKDGSGTFDTILGNVRGALDKGLTISIRVNIDKHNYEHLGELLDCLEPLPKKNLSLDYALTFTPLEGAELPHMQTLFGARDGAEAQLAAWDLTVKRGFNVRQVINIGPCTYHCSNMYVIGARGEFYKCAGMNNEDLMVGNVREGYTPRVARFQETPYWHDCADCVYLPMCMGGCRLRAVTAGKSLDQRHCRREYFAPLCDGMFRARYANPRAFQVENRE